MVIAKHEIAPAGATVAKPHPVVTGHDANDKE